MNIIMMGAQGTGKGTVAGFLKNELNIPHNSIENNTLTNTRV